MKRCLYCYRPLKDGEIDFHASCTRKFFGTSVVPQLPYSQADLKELAKRVVRSQTTIAGVQPKLSMYLDKAVRANPKLTIVGVFGNYILKPQAARFCNLPENEDLSMHLAEIAGLATVPHSLMRFADGNLCYVTKRIDRGADGEKFPMEDMAQLTLRLSEDKYKSSYERIARALREYSDNVGFDLSNLAEQVLFSWIIGNSDMHLKNFSLIKNGSLWRLSPAYDMINVKIALPNDTEELALTLNGKGGTYQYSKGDFAKAFRTFGLKDPAIDKLFSRMVKSETKLCDFISTSFLPAEKQEAFCGLIRERIARLM